VVAGQGVDAEHNLQQRSRLTHLLARACRRYGRVCVPGIAAVELPAMATWGRCRLSHASDRQLPRSKVTFRQRTTNKRPTGPTAVSRRSGLLNDQVTFLHPCQGVKTPTVPVRPRTIITPNQFDLVYQALSDATARLMVETAIESGLRWGELSELRVRGLDLLTAILTVSRAVIEVNPKFHPDGGRFLAKEYPKDKEYRRLKLSTQIVRKLRAHVTDRVSGQRRSPVSRPNR